MTRPPPNKPGYSIKKPRPIRDVEILAGRRGPSGKEAVRWEDLETLAVGIGESFARNSNIVATFGGLTASEVTQLIDSTTTYIDNEIADVQAEVAAEITSVSDLIAEVRDEAIPRIGTAENLIDEFMEHLAALAARAHDTDERIAQAGIYVDSESGTVRIAAFDQVDTRLSTAEINVSALEAEISARVTYTELNQAISDAVLEPEQIPILDDFEAQLNAAELRLDAAEADILLKADATTVSGIDVRLGTAEVDIDALEAAITLTAQQADLDAIDSRVSTAEVQLNALDVPSITQTVLDTRAQYDQLDDGAMENLAALLQAYRDREAIRQDIAFARSEISAEVTDRREAIAQASLELVALIDSNAAAITSNQLAIADTEQSLAADITTLTASVDQNTSDITAEAIARTNADSALAADITTLQTDFNGIEAEVTTQASAISTLESFAAATYTIRVAAGGAGAGFEMVAADDPISGPASAIRFTADNVLFDATVTIDHLDVDALSVSGLAVFGGALQSDDFSSGSTGWRITKAGAFELNNLVVRESLQVGSVSNTASTYSVGEINPADGATFEILNFPNPATSSEIIMVAATCQLRYPTGHSGSMELLCQFRTEIDGVWSDWKFMPIADDTIYSGLVLNTWLTVEFGIVVSADYDDIEVRFILMNDNTPPDNTIRKYGITFVTVKR